MATKKSSELKKRDMAIAYLKFGTFRKAEYATGYSKSSIHQAVKEFIRTGGFDDGFADTGDLKNLVEKNKSERHIRGGQATKRKYDIIRSVIKETCID